MSANKILKAMQAFCFSIFFQMENCSAPRGGGVLT